MTDSTRGRRGGFWIIVWVCWWATTWGVRTEAADRASRLVAVPRSGEVKLDGRLDDWDLSAALDSVYEPALAPRFSVRFAAMYDAEALYLAAHFVDDSPLVNRNDPNVNAAQAWRGDCLQVRLAPDPTMPLPLKANEFDARRGVKESTDPRIVHLTIWYFTDRKLPCMTIDRGFDFHDKKLLVGAEAPVVFRADDDGQGYTLEARLPWRLLAASPGQPVPKAGQRFALTLQPLWGSASGDRLLLSYYEVESAKGFHFQGAAGWGVLELAREGRIAPHRRAVQPAELAEPLQLTIPVGDPQAASLSAAVWSAQGELVRTLPSMAPLVLESGRAIVRWDGLDDDGRPLPPGQYTIKFLTHRGVSERWLTSLHNAGVPPWKTDDGTGAWGGDHGVPVAAAAGGGRVFLSWGFSEAGFTTIAVDEQLSPDGKPRKRWGAGSVLEIGLGTQAIATDGQRVFVGQDGRRWGDHHSSDRPNRAGVIIWNAETGRAENFPFGKRILEVSLWQGQAAEGHHDAMNLAGLAVSGDRLYVSLRRDGKVMAYDWTTGQPLRQFDIEQPKGLAVEPNGTLAVVSGRRLVRLDPETGAVAPLAAGLADPWGAAVDPQGAIYVSDRGEAMCVRVFTPDGKPLRTIGKPGGRPALGRFDPNGMLNPRGIALDAQGKLWVTESDNTPRRISVWDTRSGKLVADLLGPGHYAINGAVDLARPSWANTHHTLFEVDYATGAVKTLATLLRPRGLQFGTDGDARPVFFRHCKGRTYLVHCGREVTVIFLFDEKRLCGEPVAAITARGAARLAGITPERFPEDQRELARQKLGNDRQLHVWTDRNGDRMLQLDEIVAEPTGAPGGALWGLYWGVHVDDDLTIWAATAYEAGYVWRIPVREFLADGTPVYPPPSEQKPLFMAQYPRAISSTLPSEDGRSVYLIEQAGGDARGGGSKMAVSRYTLDGRRLWAYRKTWTGFALDAPLYRPGYVIGAMKFCGTARLDDTPTGVSELVMVNGYHGQFNLLTDGGLWVAALASDNRFSPTMSEHTYYVENFSGFFFRNRDNRRYYYIAGETDTRIMEITGLETIRTGSMALVLSPDDVRRAAEAAARRGAAPGAKPPVVVRRATPEIDGALDEWPSEAMIEIDAGGGRSARMALSRDERNLYLAYDVADDSPMKNAGSDFAMLFKSGDTCELMLAADPAADPRRKTAVAGDLRVLMSEMDGQPVAVLYEPVLRPGREKAERVFSSPTGSETFARVVVLQGAKIALARRKGGYRLEAALPLDALGVELKSGTVFRGDLGVLFSTPGGNAVGRRAYYFNQDTQITQDIPTEVRLQPANWGELRIE